MQQDWCKHLVSGWIGQPTAALLTEVDQPWVNV